MKVFISWSGEPSGKVAKALGEWIPAVLQSVEPFVSQSIPAGAAGIEEIKKHIDAADFGIVCVAGGNQASPWLNFEAGALAARFAEQRRVAPYLLDLVEKSDLKPPLGLLQAKRASKEETLELLHSINESAERPIDDVRLNDNFEKWWDDLSAKLDAARAFAGDGSEDRRTTQDMVTEILSIVRSNTPNLTPQYVFSQPLIGSTTGLRNLMTAPYGRSVGWAFTRDAVLHELLTEVTPPEWVQQVTMQSPDVAEVEVFIRAPELEKALEKLVAEQLGIKLRFVASDSGGDETPAVEA